MRLCPASCGFAPRPDAQNCGAAQWPHTAVQADADRCPVGGLSSGRAPESRGLAAAAVALGVTATMNAKLFTSIGAEVDPMLLEKDDIVYVAFDGASYLPPADTVFQPVTTLSIVPVGLVAADSPHALSAAEVRAAGLQTPPVASMQARTVPGPLMTGSSSASSTLHIRAHTQLQTHSRSRS